jgi:signal transduction histidine kinase
LEDLLASRSVAACVLEMVHDGERPDYRFLAVSPAFERSTGLHDAAGRRMRDLRPEHEDFWFDLYQRVAETGEPACFEHVAAALERRFRGHAFRIGATDAPNIVVIFEVTLETGQAGLERFGATLAHELRSPLGSMRNGLHVLKRLLQQDPRGEATLSMMDRQMERMSGLIDDMLDIGRLGSTDVRLHHENVDLHRIVADSIEACGAAVNARRHEVTVDSDGSALQVRADARRLVQLFINLLSNSVKYTPEGGHIRFRLYPLDGMAVVEVCDDGMGIQADELPKVFEMYSQGPTSQFQAEGGLGIGLSIVRSIVRLHGGTVAAHSDGRGKGSTFTVRIPLSS